MNKDLKNKIYTEYKKCWDERMATFCTKGISNAVEIDGGIFVVGKLNIQKDFYFGYSDMGQGLSYEDNNARIEAAEKEKIAYFIKRNTREIDNIIDNLHTSQFVFLYNVCYADIPINLFKHKTSNYDLILNDEKPYRNLDCEYRRATKEERAAIIKLYEDVRENFVKRLMNYLNRYSNKITFNSYWIDR